MNRLTNIEFRAHVYNFRAQALSSYTKSTAMG